MNRSPAVDATPPRLDDLVAEPGDAERAQELLDAALDTAQDVGMAALEQRIGALREN